MSLISLDNMIRPNQAGWGTASDGEVWAQKRGAQSIDITSNEARIVWVSGSLTVVMILGTRILADAEIVVRTNVSTLTDLAGPALRFIDSNNFYACVLGVTSQTLTIRKDVAGTFSTVANASFSYSVGPFYQIKYRINGTAHYAKAWADGTSEPQNWLITANDSSLAYGQYGIAGSIAAVTNVVQFDHFSVDDLVNPQPFAGGYGDFPALARVGIPMGQHSGILPGLRRFGRLLGK